MEGEGKRRGHEGEESLGGGDETPTPSHPPLHISGYVPGSGVAGFGISNDTYPIVAFILRHTV